MFNGDGCTILGSFDEAKLKQYLKAAMPAGETLRLKVCNELPAYLPDAIGALHDSFATPIAPLEVSA